MSKINNYRNGRNGRANASLKKLQEKNEKIVQLRQQLSKVNRADSLVSESSAKLRKVPYGTNRLIIVSADIIGENITISAKEIRDK